MHNREQLMDLAEHTLDLTDLDCVLVVEGEELVIAAPEDNAHELTVADHLLGLSAPTDWTAIGVVSNGWAHRDGRTSPRSERIRVAHLVDRAGNEVTALARGDRVERLTDCAGGRISDICRRVMDLATPPPLDDWSSLDCVWLDRIMTEVLDRPDGPPPDWTELESLRPGLGHGSSVASEWSELRHRVVVGQEGLGSTPPDLAAWMDDGMFARWVTSRLSDLDHLLYDLGEFLPVESHHQLSRALVRRMAS